MTTTRYSVSILGIRLTVGTLEFLIYDACLQVIFQSIHCDVKNESLVVRRSWWNSKMKIQIIIGTELIIYMGLGGREMIMLVTELQLLQWNAIHFLELRNSDDLVLSHCHYFHARPKQWSWNLLNYSALLLYRLPCHISSLSPERAPISINLF